MCGLWRLYTAAELSELQETKLGIRGVSSDGQESYCFLTSHPFFIKIGFLALHKTLVCNLTS